ncbi:MAG: hypothetical protein Q9206_007235 [Seirophora lacunosa]
MILQSHRALARLSYFRPQCLDKRVSLAVNVARVSTQLRSCIGAYDDALCTSTSTFSSSLPYRPYATNAVSRPKAHTGRTTSAPRKKAATAKATTSPTAPTTEESTTKKPASKKPAAKKSAAKKPKTTPKKKSKPRTKAKSTKARKKPTKAKKRPLTPAQKEEQTKQKHLQNIKDLKKKALEIPTKLPISAFTVLLTEQMKERHGTVKPNATNVAKDCSAIYRSFSPEQREHYNHIANQNRAVNARQYGQWIRSFTPVQIHQANLARLQLRRKTKKMWQKLEDERLVTGLRTSWSFFVAARFKSGDLAGLQVGEATKLMSSEWRALSADDKKVYTQAAEEDSAREKDLPKMYPSLLLLLTTSFLLHHLTSAIPAGPLARPVPGALLVNAQDLTPEDRANLTKWTIEVNGRNYAVSRPSALGGRRPRSGVMWPEGSAGKYFLDFHDFKTDIQWSRGQAVL